MIAKAFISSLAEILGSDNVISDPRELIAYSYDSHRDYYMPDAAAIATSTEQVAAVMALASAHRVPVVVRGAGSGTTGGSVAERGGLILNLERMNRIISINAEDRIGFVETGVITGDFQRAAAAWGLFYPPEPGSAQFSTLGGNVAESAGGLGCVKYGLTKHFVAGLEFVTSAGEVVRTGAFTDINAPFDIGAALIGSEGTLAVITAVAVRLVPLPEERVTFLAFFRTLTEAGRASNAVLTSGAGPSVLEFMDAASIETVREYANVSIPAGTGALLITEADGSPEEVAAAGEVLEETLRGAGIIELRRADAESDRTALWKLRKSLSPAIMKIASVKINEDISVPISRVPVMCEYVERLGREHNVRVVTFGHSGDGNIHVNFMVDREPSDEADRAHRAVEVLFREVVRAGGTLSGEHGIGLTKRPYIGLAIDEATLRFERRLQHVWDPAHIMNPGKIFPDETEAQE